MTGLVRRVPGALVRNCLLLAAEFAAVLLLRGPEWSWVAVLLAVFVLGAAVPHGTGAEFVARTAVALFAVGIVVLAGITWDRHVLHERGREETAVVASRTMVEDGSDHTPSLRLRTEAGRDLPGPVALDLQVGARLTVTTDPDGGSWSLGGRPGRPLWQAAGTAALLLLQTVTLGVLCLRRPRT
ncbi:hypothetical protein PV721_12890 [Streptomyces sp. MB09-01]|uniref:hypothetical protein n=1 Tax=Streptomyces sp. MB09-01 TaxID=3028666 RepID=UPI0029B87FCF|nr:hypothetical protein [Streptomyces sp. MB09-01]MDX3535257.1 hypothetical protein [Streptomyces sp. MB09-01]